jgi:hypothetical protein
MERRKKRKMIFLSILVRGATHRSQIELSYQPLVRLLQFRSPSFFSSSLGNQQFGLTGSECYGLGRRCCRSDGLDDGRFPEAARPVQGEGVCRKRAGQGAAVRTDRGRKRDRIVDN